MKTIQRLLAAALLAACSCFSVSCESTNVPGSTPRPPVLSYEDFIEPAARAATVALLDKATSPEDRVDKARLANEVATALALVTSPDATAQDISAAILARTGNKPHWVLFASVLGNTYDRYKSRLGTSKATEIIHKIATGVKGETASYLVEA